MAVALSTMFIADLAAAVACSFLDMWPRKVACIFFAAWQSSMEWKTVSRCVISLRASNPFQIMYIRLPLSSGENSSSSCSFVGSFSGSEGASSVLVRSDAVSDTLKLFLAWCPRKAACIFVAAAASFSFSPSASFSFSLSEDSVFVAVSSAAFEISSKRSN